MCHLVNAIIRPMPDLSYVETIVQYVLESIHSFDDGVTFTWEVNKEFGCLQVSFV